jgi:hypothetical protein
MFAAMMESIKKLIYVTMPPWQGRVTGGGSFRPALQALEDRTLPSTYIWQGSPSGAVSWSTKSWQDMAGNLSTLKLPDDNLVLRFTGVAQGDAIDDMKGLTVSRLEVNFAVRQEDHTEAGPDNQSGRALQRDARRLRDVDHQQGGDDGQVHLAGRHAQGPRQDRRERWR